MRRWLSGTARRHVERAAISLFGKFFRLLPRGSLKLAVKGMIFDQYLGWRHVEMTARTWFGASMHARFPDRIQSTIFLTGCWEPGVTEVIADGLAPGDVFIDIGANVGYYSLLAASRVGTEGMVYAVEASPAIFAMLASNVERNRCRNVASVNCAVSNTSGECDIYMAPDRNLGHSTIIASVAAADGHSLEARVRCAPLSELVPRDELLRARFIKIDIEGAERLALEGIAPLMNSFDARTEWLVELSTTFSPNGSSDVEWIFDLFTSTGYRAYAVANDYTEDFYFGDDVPRPLKPLERAPGGLSDVLFSKRRSASPL